MAGKRINMNKLFDDFVATEVANEEGDSETRGVQLLRNMWRAAEDTEHKDSGPTSRYLMDHMMGRPQIKVELTAPQGIQVDASAAVLAMMGVKSLTGTFVNAEGESEEMTVRPVVEGLDD